ncbi:LOW QUALITY PROTEIN: V-type immunoglobulin domain-containing suppressor of T-cell activation [Brachyhypopomus gauderio]|uniref:LOW QUALITY PROTEIN: V-type immunoglobulin domain-containing suppressor of T-cell activation n=1 Tax=Brachyhypopomus gauderio TaxID=698409 RepID=UPI00404202E8
MALSAGSLTFPVFFTAFIVVQAQGGHHSHSHGLGVSSLHTSYVCPEGANATLVCTQSGSKAHLTDVLKHVWFFTPHMDQHCKNILHPRIHGNRTLGVVHKVHDSAFSLTLMEVTKADEGRYCCQSTEVLGRDKNNHTKLLHAHSNMILTVHSRDDSAGQNKNPKCMEFDIRPPAGSSVAAGLASAVCIMGVLCLPLILLLVYRQRQGAQRSRRAHELVRMDR